MEEVYGMDVPGRYHNHQQGSIQRCWYRWSGVLVTTQLMHWISFGQRRSREKKLVQLATEQIHTNILCWLGMLRTIAETRNLD